MCSLVRFRYFQFYKLHSRQFSVYEPPESWYESLGLKKDEIPRLDKPINLKLRGYDFVVLEKVQSKLHSILKSLAIQAKDAHGTPAKSSKIITFKRRSKIPENHYILNMYERNIILSSVTSLNMPILYEIITTILPEGVNLKFDYYTEKDENYLYIQDSELQTLKTGLNIMTQEEEEKMNESLVKKRLKEESKILKNLSKIL